MTTYTSLLRANQARQKEWDPEGKIDVSFKAIELVGEVGELLNVVKKMERARLGLRGSRALPGQLADELADVIICVSLLAARCGVDLQSAVVNKFNATSADVGIHVYLSPEWDEL